MGTRTAPTAMTITMATTTSEAAEVGGKGACLSLEAAHAPRRQRAVQR
jgi:hypothetical protein